MLFLITFITDSPAALFLPYFISRSNNVMIVHVVSLLKKDKRVTMHYVVFADVAVALLLLLLLL